MENLEVLNVELKKLGLPTLILIDPRKCIGQKVNARYMDQQVFKQLVQNLKDDGRLESTPLLYELDGKYYTISGHHRIKAAIEANLELILCMCTTVKDQEELLAKQLSHNAIVGEDDEIKLKEMFEEIKSIESKMYSGIQSEIEKIDYVSLNFRAGCFEEMLLVTFPEEIKAYDDLIEDIEKSQVHSGTATRVVENKDFQKFLTLLSEIKKSENIKSNQIGFGFMVNLAKEKWDETKQTD